MKLLLLGPPGAGKGTQADFISTEFAIPQISTGNIFRENIKNNTVLGIKIQEYMNAGQLVPDELAIDLVENRLEQEDTKEGYLLDGFPRTIKQAEALAKIITLDAVLELKIEDEVIVQRLAERFFHKESGRTYHTQYNPPKKSGFDDVTNEPLVQREDDKEATVLSRLDVYHKQTEPLVNFYQNPAHSKKYFVIKADDSIADIRKQILKICQNI